MQGYKMVYPRDGGTRALEITASDLQTLDLGAMINDTVIELFIKRAQTPFPYSDFALQAHLPSLGPA